MASMVIMAIRKKTTFPLYFSDFFFIFLNCNPENLNDLQKLHFYDHSYDIFFCQQVLRNFWKNGSQSAYADFFPLYIWMAIRWTEIRLYAVEQLQY